MPRADDSLSKMMGELPLYTQGCSKHRSLSAERNRLINGIWLTLASISKVAMARQISQELTAHHLTLLTVQQKPSGPMRDHIIQVCNDLLRRHAAPGPEDNSSDPTGNPPDQPLAAEAGALTQATHRGRALVVACTMLGKSVV